MLKMLKRTGLFCHIFFLWSAKDYVHHISIYKNAEITQKCRFFKALISFFHPIMISDENSEKCCLFMSHFFSFKRRRISASSRAQNIYSIFGSHLDHTLVVMHRNSDSKQNFGKMIAILSVHGIMTSKCNKRTAPISQLWLCSLAQILKPSSSFLNLRL